MLRSHFPYVSEAFFWIVLWLILTLLLLAAEAILVPEPVIAWFLTTGFF